MGWKSNRWGELVLLFVLLPLSLLLPYATWIKVLSILIGLVYVIYISFSSLKIKLNLKKVKDWKSFWTSTLKKLVLISIVTIMYVWFVDPDALFCVPLNKPLLWVQILFIYTFISVWPQDFIFRTFFFKRYAPLFKDPRLLIIINAILFSFAHLFFLNALVMVVTLAGGFLFAITFHKTDSTTLVSIEHALYGNWLFTVGLGQMLAFPGMDACM